MKIYATLFMPILVVYSEVRPAVKPKALSFKNFLPWAKDIPQSEYKKHINIHLVDKTWRPTLKDLTTGGQSAKEYDPSVVYKAFNDLDITYSSRLEPFENAKELVTGSHGYDRTLETIFIISTLSGSARDHMAENIILAMVLRNILKKYNVFVLDMENLEGSMEVSVAKALFGMKSSYYGLAKTIGDVIHEISVAEKGLLEMERIHLIGYCFSAQLAGFVARYLKELEKKKIKSILALDPHSLGLSRLRNTFVSADDAEVVHAYHTNSLWLGTLRRAATADIVFNNGSWQPGCGLSNTCSHHRAPKFLWYIIVYPEKFKARKCSSWFAFKLGLCKRKDVITLTFPPKKDDIAIGRFYIKTTSTYPYGYGDKGAN